MDISLQYKSPSPSFPSLPSAFFSASTNSPHNQAGYSESSFATGPSFAFTYPNPLSTVPAFTELLGAAGVSDADAGKGGTWGVKGVENGCAADLDVAAGGPSCVPEGAPRGEVCVLWLGEMEAGAR